MVVRIGICLTLIFFSCSGKKTEKISDEKNATQKSEADMNQTNQPSGKRPLQDVAPADRLNYYTEPPKMIIDESKNYVATIRTHRGDIVIAMDSFYAPLHTNNFVFLTRQGFYDGLIFHRLEPNFVLQGGDPLGDGTGGPGYTLPAEFGLQHEKYAVAAARKGNRVNPEKRSSGSQFYITYKPAPFLDQQGYTVFGRVIEGSDVVETMTRGDVMIRIDIEEK